MKAFKDIKLEPRGKYAGIKVHLSKEDVEAILSSKEAPAVGMDLVQAIRKGTKKLMLKVPNLLADRTIDDIKKELKLEMEKSKLKLEAIEKGQDWKEVHVK